MEHMRRIAYETVLRACGFASLGIFCVMTGMSFNPKMAFQTGGFLTTIMAFVLVLKAREALTKDYRKTEMWLYIDKDFRPPEAYAQWASATVLRDTYLTFAMWTSMISIAMWVLALIFSLVGTSSTLALDNPRPRPAVTQSPGAAPPEGMDTTTLAPDQRRPMPSIRYQVFQ
jgi:Ca2+/H+ antiporter